MRGGAGALVAFLSVAACGSFGETTPATASTDAGDAAVADGGSGGQQCPSGRGSPMVRVDGYCIDVREATNEDYTAFANAAPALPTDAACAWKTSFAPTCGESGASLPVTCVDWCDARAFCAWAGKRLCGRRGGGGAALNGAASDPAASEWAYACVDRDLSQAYPYGREYREDACNTAHGASAIAAPKAFGACKGTLGAFDLLGNVIEWVDDCAAGSDAKNDACRTVGDSFRFTAAPGDGKCSNEDSNPRSFRADDVGIRCCADALP